MDEPNSAQFDTNSPKAESTSATGQVPDSPAPDAAMAGRVIPLNDASFADAVLNRTGLALAVFTAAWCGSPWEHLSPVLDEIAATEQDYLLVGLLDIDESPRTAREYLVRAVPAMLLFSEGRRVENLIGALPRRTIMNNVSKHVRK